MDHKGRYVQEQKDSKVNMVEEEMKKNDALKIDKYHQKNNNNNSWPLNNDGNKRFKYKKLG